VQSDLEMEPYLSSSVVETRKNQGGCLDSSANVQKKGVVYPNTSNNGVD